MQITHTEPTIPITLFTWLFNVLFTVDMGQCHEILYHFYFIIEKHVLKLKF